MMPRPIDKVKIKSIFESMEYGEVLEHTASVKTWLDTNYNNVIYSFGIDRENPPEIKTVVKDVNSNEDLVTVYEVGKAIKEISKDQIKCVTWSQSTSAERSNLMNEFAVEIQKNSDFICKIESLTRGLLAKDTKQYGVHILSEYLQYFANWTTQTEGKVHDDITAVYLDSNVCLGMLGFALGPALARKETVVFCAPPQLSVVIAFLIKLSIKVGIPDGALKLIVNNSSMLPFQATKYIFVEKNRIEDLYRISDLIYGVSNSKCPLIIYSNCDLDAAIECAVSAIWEYGGMLPWAADTIFVQEDVYQEFLRKFKQRLQRLRVGNGIDKLVDISYPMKNDLENLDSKIKDARKQRIDVYQPLTGITTFQPTLFIEMKVYNDNSKNMSPAATILPFRTPKESVALANNSRQGVGASIWCENISLVNEITRQLNVGNVWVNCHGIIHPDIPFTSFKCDIEGYMGGPLGFYENEDCQVSDDEPDISDLVLLPNIKKAQSSWSKLSHNARIKVLSDWVRYLQKHPSILEEIGAKDPQEILQSCIAKYSTLNNSTMAIDGYAHVAIREAVGIIALFLREDINLSFIIGSLLLGNTVVLLTEGDPTALRNFAKTLPGTILNVTQILDVFLCSPVYIYFVHSEYKKRQVYTLFENLDQLFRRCTITKNIWIPVGDSI